MPSYGITKVVDLPYQQAVDKVTDALKAEGFGVLTTINVQETLKQKLGVDLGDYVILGACNPQLAYQALQTEQEIGLLLPCNVIVYTSGGKTAVSVLDPQQALGITNNESLSSIAEEAKGKLERALAAV
jgi:uncharacterized protein (DUF302 family)